MEDGRDMIVGLTRLPAYEVGEGIKIKRAFSGDKGTILSFIREHFQESWEYEAEHAMMQEPCKCFLATENGRLLGFACFDSAAKGFFGPIGVSEEARGKNVGKALLIRTMEAMREYGYAYAIIGWVNTAEQFYRKTVGAEFIKDAHPKNSVYSNLVYM